MFEHHIISIQFLGENFERNITINSSPFSYMKKQTLFLLGLLGVLKFESFYKILNDRIESFFFFEKRNEIFYFFFFQIWDEAIWINICFILSRY